MINKSLEQKITEAPCIFCGYNGAGYYQKHTHGKHCPYYEIGGNEERKDALPDIIKRHYNKAVPVKQATPVLEYYHYYNPETSDIQRCATNSMGHPGLGYIQIPEIQYEYIKYHKSKGRKLSILPKEGYHYILPNSVEDIPLDFNIHNSCAFTGISIGIGNRRFLLDE